MSNNFIALLVVAWAISTQIVIYTQASRVINHCAIVETKDEN